MVVRQIQYYNDIDKDGGCDCSLPHHTLRSHKRLGAAAVVHHCCIAVKAGGGTPTFNGVPLTEFVREYEFTHERASGRVPEFVVADHPWNEDEDVITQEATPVVYLLDRDGLPQRDAQGRRVVEVPATPEVTRKKGPAPAWLKARLVAKGAYKEAPIV